MLFGLYKSLFQPEPLIIVLDSDNSSHPSLAAALALWLVTTSQEQRMQMEKDFRAIELQQEEQLLRKAGTFGSIEEIARAEPGPNG